MTGLQKIIDKIGEESTALCDRIIEEANNNANSLISKARKDGNEKAEKIILEGQKEADRIIAVAKSSADSVTKTKHLGVKNAVLNDIISAAYEEILNYDNEKYFDLLYKICVKYVETGECRMHLNSMDLAHIPKDFETKINMAVFEKAAVQISRESVDIENGFILDYGDFRVNCTLKAVFDNNMDVIKDMLSKELFN